MLLQSTIHNGAKRYERATYYDHHEICVIRVIGADPN